MSRGLLRRGPAVSDKAPIVLMRDASRDGTAIAKKGHRNSDSEDNGYHRDVQCRSTRAAKQCRSRVLVKWHNQPVR